MTENKRRWNKIAVFGSWAGHPSGPFSMDAKTFSEIEANFKKDGIPIVADWDHASEQPPDSTAKACGDAPASGWLHKVEARDDGLWAEVEWLPKAKAQIQAGEYKFISPAIRFGSRDTVTGLPTGAKLSSIALCQKPFLKTLPPALASDSAHAFLCSEITTEELAREGPDYALSPNEFLPKFRSILKLHELADSDAIIDQLDRLEELCEQADGDPLATVEGVNLSEYIPPLREYMRMPANTTLSDLLDAVADMVDDSQGVEMSDIPSVATQQTDDAPAPVITKETNIVMETITLTEHTVKLTEAVSAAVAKAEAPLTLQIKEHESAVAKALSDLAAAEAKVLELTDQIKTRDAAVAAARVDEAFSTYKETKKLSDDDKEAMAITLSTKPELFEKLYPKMAPEKALLLRTVTASDTTKGASITNFKTVPDFSVVLASVKEKNPTLDYDKQFEMAYKEHATLMAG